ncbi:MAG TPA: zinc ribbon domain-containing protein [Candidatus Glassbacteria bacterium]|nr:zinc ribbon domain-containing protein [Candidatus Glassbacteria bacterium]
MTINTEQLKAITLEKTIKSETVYLEKLPEFQNYEVLSNILNRGTTDVFNYLENLSDDSISIGRLILTEKNLVYFTKGTSTHNPWKKTFNWLQKFKLGDEHIRYKKTSEFLKYFNGKIKGKKKEELEIALDNQHSFVIPAGKIVNFERIQETSKLSGKLTPRNLLIIISLEKNDKIQPYAMLGPKPGTAFLVDQGKWVKNLEKIMLIHQRSKMKIQSDNPNSKTKITCIVCGTTIPDGKNVCPNCGDTYS